MDEALLEEIALIQQELDEYKQRDASHRQAAQLKEVYVMGLLEEITRLRKKIWDLQSRMDDEGVAY